MKLSEELFSKQLHTIKHVLVQIDLSEDLDDNNVFKMAQVRSSILIFMSYRVSPYTFDLKEQINKIEKWYEHLQQVNTSHSTTF